MTDAHGETTCAQRVSDVETSFARLADLVTSAARAGERITALLSAERSDFVRFNHARVRQAGSVDQRTLRVHLAEGARHAESSFTLAGDATDEAIVRDAIEALRGVVADLPDDPHMVTPETLTSTRMLRGATLPSPDAVIAAITEAAGSDDLVGFYAAGPMVRGFVDSRGQRNWHEVESFSFDWSLYRGGDRAIKVGYAGQHWSNDELDARMRAAREQSYALDRPPHTITPGRYRAYLAPAAVQELTTMLSWGGFSGRARATRQGCLLRMQQGEARMSPMVTLRENLAEGMAPTFQSDGFVRPECVTLIQGGVLGDALVSPRTGREFSIVHNGSTSAESPDALEMSAGDLPTHDVLRALGTGIYVGNLWYLNFSDRAACRVTGMTRFGTFWVENGQVVAPLNVMRFDDSVLRLLGESLEALTVERDFLPSTATWRERSLESARLPGALLRELTFTL